MNILIVIMNILIVIMNILVKKHHSTISHFSYKEKQLVFLLMAS